jgi:hypothetical protein
MLALVLLFVAGSAVVGLTLFLAAWGVLYLSYKLYYTIRRR